jgi:hypothetical protein
MALGRRRVHVAVGICAVLAFALPAIPTGRDDLPALHATRTAAFVTPDGTERRLWGLNVQPVWAGRPGRTWGAARYEAIAAKGFNAVRFVLHWDDFEPRRGDLDPASLATLDTAVARAKAAGLYVTLDMIHLWGPRGLSDVPEWARSGDSVATVEANGGPYVGALAARYADEPAVAAYDPVNEPRRWPIDQDAVLRMYDRLIATIRPPAPRKIVLVEPSYGDSSIGPGCADLSSLSHRDNVVFSVHDYFAGGDDDGFGRACEQAGTQGGGGAAGYDVSDVAALRAHLQSYLDVLEPAGLPLVVGEFGMAAGAPHRDAWVRDMVALLGSHRLSGMWWEYWTSTKRGALSATNRDGSWRPVAELLVARPPADPRIVAAGDFTSCRGRRSCAHGDVADVRAVMAAEHPDAILGIGDFQYPTIDAIGEGFDRVFGPKRRGWWSRIRPTAGPTHDVRGCSDDAYASYWGRDPMKGYSFDLGAWHIVSLPSAAYRYGCDTRGVLAWLESDLAVHRRPCTLAFWQDPYWTRPTARHGRERELRPWIEALYEHGADVVLQASNHNYQRFDPQDPRDRRDPARGLRSFVVGTGGIGLYRFTGTAPNLAAASDRTHGALRLDLHAEGYDWRFLPTAGSFADAGSGRCH